MSTLKLHSGTRKMLWGQPGLFSLTSNQNSWSNPSFAFCSPAQGYHCREMVISEESVCPGHPSAAVIRQCKSQSKVQLTHSDLCWLSRTKRQNNKKIKKPLFHLGVAAPAISTLGGQFWQVWRYVLTVFFYVKS